MFDSVRVKLTFWYTGVLALVLLSFSGGVYALMARKLHNRLDGGLQTAMEGTVRLFIHEKDEGDPDRHAAQSALRKYYYPREAIAFFDQSGQLVEEQPQGALHAALPAAVAALDKDGLQFFTRSEAETHAEDGMRLIVQRLQYKSSPPVFIVIGQEREELENDLELLSSILYVAVPLALFLTAIGGWWLARKALAPVAAMSETARRISAVNLEQQLPVANPRDELGQLATTFNDLLARLNAAFAQQRQFMADASHELRTPLSVIHTTAQVTLERPRRDESEYREALALMDQQAQRLGRIVAEMFTLARADAGQRPLTLRDFYLDELVTETARAAAVLAARKNIALKIAPTHETPFRGDEDLLRQLLLNLLDNAIKFTPAGGVIRLQLERRNDTYQLVVADTGAGIPAAAQAHIFERFYRVDKARSRTAPAKGSGAGLGLSIARWIAEAHGGALHLVQSDADGSTFVLSLPVTQ